MLGETVRSRRNSKCKGSKLGGYGILSQHLGTFPTLPSNAALGGATLQGEDTSHVKCSLGVAIPLQLKSAQKLIFLKASEEKEKKALPAGASGNWVVG